MTPPAPPFRRLRPGLTVALSLAMALSGCTVSAQGTAGVTGAKAAKPAEKAVAATPSPPAPSATPAGATAVKPSAAPVTVAPPTATAPRGLLVPSHVLPALPTSLVKMMGDQTAGLVGSDGGTLIGLDGSTLIGNDGSTLIGNDGSTLVGNDGSTLVGNDGSTYQLSQLGKNRCAIVDRPLSDVVRLIREDLALVAEVARIPAKTAKASARVGMQMGVATVFDPKVIFGKVTDDASTGPMANNPALLPLTFFAEAFPGGNGGLFVYQAADVDHSKNVYGVKITSPRKGEVFSHRTNPTSEAFFALNFDLNAGLAVADCYRNNKSEFLFPGKTRYRIELAQLPVASPDGTTFVFRAARRVRPTNSGCPELNYSLLARFDAQGRGAVRLVTIDGDQPVPRFVSPDGARGVEPTADLAFYLGSEGLAGVGAPDPAVVGMLGGMADMLPIPALAEEENPANEAVFTPLQAESQPTGKRVVTLEEVQNVMASGVLLELVADQSNAIDGGFGVPQATK